MKQKIPAFHNSDLNPKENELKSVQKQIQIYQKKNIILKNQINSKTSYDKIVDLENKYKSSEIRNKELEKRVKTLEEILRNQGRILNKKDDIHDTSSKFKSLNEELKQCKKYNKNFEKRLQTEDHNFQKQHEYLINLQK